MPDIRPSLLSLAGAVLGAFAPDTTVRLAISPDGDFTVIDEDRIAPFAHRGIARVCHQANKAWCESIGDNSQLDWEAAPEWQRASAMKGVKFCIDNPSAPASANHDSWSAEKVAGGWVYGSVKDSTAKTHPCLVPFGDLPADQQAKDKLFKAIVAALA